MFLNWELEVLFQCPDIPGGFRRETAEMKLTDRRINYVYLI